jgi:hypothetical protein
MFLRDMMFCRREHVTSPLHRKCKIQWRGKHLICTVPRLA